MGRVLIDLNYPDALELLEERAAIVEEGCKCSRYISQSTVARAYGYQTWGDLLRDVKARQ